METDQSVSPLNLGEHKATEGMRGSLSRLLNLLRCPLCNQLFNKPTTLCSCAHSFCVKCIDEYARDACVCPVEGCRMPMSLVGGHGGSFRKINPQLAQTVESVKLICQQLNQSSDDWWKTASHDYVLKPPPTINEESITSGMDGKVDADCSDDEDMIDLQGSPSLLHDSISDDDD